jgi:polysaccharide export outer membrane protein
MKPSKTTGLGAGSKGFARAWMIAAICWATLGTLLCCALPATAQKIPPGLAFSQPTTKAVIPSGAPAQQSTDNPKAVGDDRPALQHRDASRYRLCASDVIALTFPQTPEFNQTVNVQPDGYVSLTAVGDVHLEGMTSQEAIVAIKSAYEPILHEPLLTLELKDFNKPYFTVGGHVFKPGKFDLRGATTATEAVTMAGGFMESAKHSQVLLFRRVDDSWTEVKNLDLKHILQGHDISEDPELRSGDMLYVPQNFISKVKKFIPNYGMGSYYDFHP